MLKQGQITKGNKSMKEAFIDSVLSTYPPNIITRKEFLFEREKFNFIFLPRIQQLFNPIEPQPIKKGMVNIPLNGVGNSGGVRVFPGFFYVQFIYCLIIKGFT